MDTLAWNNGIGLGSYFVGFRDRGPVGGIRIQLSEVKFLDLCEQLFAVFINQERKSRDDQIRRTARLGIGSSSAPQSLWVPSMPKAET